MISLEQLLQPEMNGYDEDVMRSLLVSLQIDASPTTLINMRVVRYYQAELWARGISKEKFIEWVKTINPGE